VTGWQPKGGRAAFLKGVVLRLESLGEGRERVGVGKSVGGIEVLLQKGSIVPQPGESTTQWSDYAGKPVGGEK